MTIKTFRENVWKYLYLFLCRKKVVDGIGFKPFVWQCWYQNKLHKNWHERESASVKHFRWITHINLVEWLGDCNNSYGTHSDWSLSLYSYTYIVQHYSNKEDVILVNDKRHTTKLAHVSFIDRSKCHMLIVYHKLQLLVYCCINLGECIYTFVWLNFAILT